MPLKNTSPVCSTLALSNRTATSVSVCAGGTCVTASRSVQPRPAPHAMGAALLSASLVANVADLETDLRERLQTTLSDAYRLERELGGGGMSRVFLAEELALGRRVVVKVLSPDLAAGVNFERFQREILVTARLQHPHIVPVFTAGETSGLPYYTMPFVEGESGRFTGGEHG